MATVSVFNHHVHRSFYWLALVDTSLFVMACYAGTYIYNLVDVVPGASQEYMQDNHSLSLRYGALRATHA